MFRDIPILNYPQPEAIGFGIARGSASYLLVGEDVLDYSGKLLNLAARLNELARPFGVVVDGNYKFEIIPKKFRKRFQKHSVYLRGIAEEFPTRVFTSDQVSIPTSARYPIREPVWKLVTVEKTVAEINAMFGTFSVCLPNPPLVPEQTKAEVRWVSPKIKSTFEELKCDLTSQTVDGSGYFVKFDLDEVHSLMKNQGLDATAKVQFRVHYIPKGKPKRKKRN